MPSVHVIYYVNIIDLMIVYIFLLAENSYTSIEDSSREDDLPLMCLICPDKGKMKVTTAAATTSSTHGDTFTRCEMIRKASSC